VVSPARPRKSAQPHCACMSNDFAHAQQNYISAHQEAAPGAWLLQREVAQRTDTDTWTYLNWEKDKTLPVAARCGVPRLRPHSPGARDAFRAPESQTAVIGTTFARVARYLEWDPGTLTRYLNGTWRMPPARATVLARLLSAMPSELDAIYRLSRHSQRRKVLSTRARRL
jgi:hypothetical protein